MFEFSIFISFQLYIFSSFSYEYFLNYELFQNFQMYGVFLNYPFLISKLLALWLKNLISMIKFCDVCWEFHYGLAVVHFYKYFICTKF